MSSNLREFNLELDRDIVQLTDVQLLKLARYLALLGIRKITLRTPVDTGLTRANWQATNGAPAKGTTRATDRSGAATMRAAEATVAQMQAYAEWNYTNNLEHILVLEEGGFVPADPGPSHDPRPDRIGRVLVRGGFSAQAAHGMVGPTFDELNRIVPPA